MMDNMAFFAIIPLLIYLAIIGFAIWFCVSLINAQKERNRILQEISTKLDNVSPGKKEE